MVIPVPIWRLLGAQEPGECGRETPAHGTMGRSSASAQGSDGPEVAWAPHSAPPSQGHLLLPPLLPSASTAPLSCWQRQSSALGVFRGALMCPLVLEVQATLREGSHTSCVGVPAGCMGRIPPLFSSSTCTGASRPDLQGSSHYLLGTRGPP